MKLFTPLTLGSLTLKNRIVISPMCQYSAKDGFASDWHLVQYGRFAVGGAGMVIVEDSAVSPDGRITFGDLGIWDDAHIPGLARISSFLREQGAASCIQLGHAGRKAAAQRPWHGAGPLGVDDIKERNEAAWPTIAPSAISFGETWPTPMAMDHAAIQELVTAYEQAAKRALAAGFDAIELHCAHGYLLHQFLSALSNQRDDEFGGDLKRRMRLPLEIVSRLRRVWPKSQPIFVRVSAVDHAEGGIELEDTIAFAKALKELGVDVVDCSSGGLVGAATAGRVPRGLGFQVPYAEAVNREAGISCMTVGLILSPQQAEEALQQGNIDLVAIGRAALDDPNWPLHAKRTLCGEAYEGWPEQHGWWLERRASILRKINA